MGISAVVSDETVAPSSRPRIIPDAYVLLSNWRYIEYSILRIIAGWGRCAGDWDDKLAVCYHTWLQAEIVQRMRKRLDMFPGGKPDAPVNAVFERLCNTVLMAAQFRRRDGGYSRRDQPSAGADVQRVHQVIAHRSRPPRRMTCLRETDRAEAPAARVV